MTVKVDVHSELLGAYPWTGTKVPPTAADNVQDTAAYEDGTLVFRDGANEALAASDAHSGRAARSGLGFRGPQPGTVCKDGDKVAPSACDDGPHGRGAGGQLRYRVTVPAGGRETVWIAVAAGRRELDAALKTDPDEQLQAKIGRPHRARAAARGSTCPATARCRSRSTGASRTSPT